MCSAAKSLQLDQQLGQPLLQPGPGGPAPAEPGQAGQEGQEGPDQAGPAEPAVRVGPGAGQPRRQERHAGIHSGHAGPATASTGQP